MTIDELFIQGCRKRSDICEHLPILKEYAGRVNHVTEFGVRWGVSTIAFLAGRPKVLRSYDISNFNKYERYRELTKETDFIFTKANVLNIEIDETDLLFIDTLHTYNQLKEELKRHGNKSRHFIIFHDTETFGYIGQDKKSPGLVLAIEEFLKMNKDWSKDRVFKNNNGLYIIRRF